MVNKKGSSSVLDNAKKRYGLIKDKLSILRKRGADTSIEDIELIPIKSDITLYEATNDQKDLDKVIKVLGVVEKEADSLERNLIVKPETVSPVVKKPQSVMPSETHDDSDQNPESIHKRKAGVKKKKAVVKLRNNIKKSVKRRIRKKKRL